MSLMGRLAILTGLILGGAFLLLPPVSNATHDFYTCRLYVTVKPPLFKLKLCAWGSFETNNDKIVEVIQAVRQGTALNEPLSVTVVIVDPGMLSDGLYGLYEPVTKTIFINGEIPDDDDYKGYYTLGHELVHAILDQQHMDWDKQHCFMGGPVLDPLRETIKRWNPEARFENQIQLILACRQGAE